MAFRNVDHQLSFLEGPEIDAAVAGMAASGVESRGAVFTRREVVDFILDLAGYTTDQPLHLARVLEPSMGHGDFLLPVIDRLFDSYRRVIGDKGDVVEDLGDCLLAVELHRASYDEVRALVTDALKEKGLAAAQSRALCERWLRQGDFLLLPLEQTFTHVIGNPPYVRQELIPDVLMPASANSPCVEPSTVSTSKLLSKRVLRASHDVSGTSRQAWQAAPCSGLSSSGRRRGLWGSGLWRASCGSRTSGGRSAELRAGCGSLRTDLYTLLLGPV